MDFSDHCTLRKKSPYSELFWSTFFPHLPAFGVNTERFVVGKCGKNSDQNNFEYGLFLRSDIFCEDSMIQEDYRQSPINLRKHFGTFFFLKTYTKQKMYHNLTFFCCVIQNENYIVPSKISMIKLSVKLVSVLAKKASLTGS